MGKLLPDPGGSNKSGGVSSHTDLGGPTWNVSSCGGVDVVNACCAGPRPLGRCCRRWRAC